jgi:hypothetical protein
VTSARDQIVRILQSLTDISAAELGRRVGVSRERVRQILKDLGYPTARGKGRPYGSGALTALGNVMPRIGKAAAVQIVAEDLLSKGFAIYAPVRVGKAGDLVAIEGTGAVSLISIGGRFRPAVKPGKGRRRRGAGLRGVKAYNIRRAFVTPGGPVRYDPPFASSPSMRVARAN